MGMFLRQYSLPTVLRKVWLGRSHMLMMHSGRLISIIRRVWQIVAETGNDSAGPLAGRCTV